MAIFNNPRQTAGTATTSAPLARGFHTPVDATSGAKTMTLPTNAPIGGEISVEKVDVSANAVTVSGTIRGTSSTIDLSSQYDARTFLSEGNGSWRPISDHRTQTSLDARYARAAGSITPEMFGAKGDYNPSANTGTDDTVAWQSAISACLAFGARLDAPAKNYRITDTLAIIDAKGFDFSGSKGGLQGGITALSGTWLHYTGATTKPMLRVEGTSNFTLDGINFHGRNVADGIRIVSDNSPSVTNHTYRNSFLFRVQTGVYINDGAGVTQSDQMLFEDVRMAEVVNICFRTNSVNVTGVKWLRCTTGLASSADNTVHYQFDRGAMLSLDSCFGALGQDFVRIGGPLVSAVTIDNCQSEGTTNPAPAFLRVGATTDAGFQDTTTMRNCIPDGPVILAGPTRTLYSVGNLWHSGTSVSVTGNDATFISDAETSITNAAVTLNVTGINARLLRRHSLYSNGVPTSGKHFAGEIVQEYDPVGHGVTSWVCTASGTPGTFEGVRTKATLDAAYTTVTEAPLNASRYTTLQAAADAMPTAGGTLRIPPGTYTGDVSFKPKTRVIGSGRGATTIVGTVTFNSAEGNTLSDVTITPSANATGLKIVGAHRSAFQRINIERGVNGGGTGMQITASGGVPVFYNDFEDISITHFAGGGRGVLLECVANTDWMTSCSFKRVTMRGDSTVKMAQGVRANGPGVIQHVTWEDCYVEYVTFEGWFFDTTTTYQVMINVITEAAGTAYVLYGNYVTAINVNGFGNTTDWDFGTSAGHRILGPQLMSLDFGTNGVLKTSSLDLGALGVVKASPVAAAVKVPIDVGGGAVAAAGDTLTAYGVGRGNPAQVGTTQLRGGVGDSLAHGVDLYVNGQAAALARGNGAGSKFELSDARDLVVGTTTGSRIAVSPAQKIAFYGNTPVVRPSLTYSRATETAATAGLRAVLVTLGLVTDSTVA